MADTGNAQAMAAVARQREKGAELVAAMERCLDALEQLTPGKQKPLLLEVKAIAEEAGQHLFDMERRVGSLEALLATDELTNLLNRRGFQDQLRRVLAMAGRHGGQGVLAFLDLDGFKAINDRLGHNAGDAVIERVAEILAANTRAGDIVARLGGDEFVVLLVHSGWRWGQMRARQLQRMINRSFARYREYRIPLRASLGVTTYRPGDTAEELLARADEAMYEDKRERATLVHIAAAKIARQQSIERDRAPSAEA